MFWLCVYCFRYQFRCCLHLMHVLRPHFGEELLTGLSVCSICKEFGSECISSWSLLT